MGYFAQTTKKIMCYIYKYNYASIYTTYISYIKIYIYIHKHKYIYFLYIGKTRKYQDLLDST